MDQDATSYGSRPRPRRHCVRRGPSSPLKRGTAHHFSAHVYCGQMAGWIKMPLGTKVPVGLGPGHSHCVRWGPICLPSIPCREGHSPPPVSSPCLLWHRPSQLLLSTCFLCGFCFAGCKVMIASRKLERLQKTANELQQYLPSNGTAELDFMECNIRNENQVFYG